MSKLTSWRQTTGDKTMTTRIRVQSKKFHNIILFNMFIIKVFILNIKLLGSGPERRKLYKSIFFLQSALGSSMMLRSVVGDECRGRGNGRGRGGRRPDAGPLPVPGPCRPLSVAPHRA